MTTTNLPTYSRAKPFIAHLKERKLLNKSGSNKQTYHVSVDLTGSNIVYAPGDTVAIFPSNHPLVVEKLLEHFSHSPDTLLFDPRSKARISLRKFLSDKVNLKRSSNKLAEILGTSGTFPDLASCMEAAGPFSGSLDAFASACAPILPRFYSIASSMHTSPTSIDLLIATFKHQIGEKLVPGVGSDFLCHTATTSTPIPLYLQPTKHFRLPDPDVPIIMIGPGTGVAPYRAFLQERIATNAAGPNWLFFGEQQGAYDFYYEQELKALQEKGHLVLDTAFSRDQKDKLYVQHRMLEKAKELKQWIEDGAHVYICGDAKRMAKDVVKTLEQIADPAYIKEMRLNKRLLLDVY